MKGVKTTRWVVEYYNGAWAAWVKLDEGWHNLKAARSALAEFRLRYDAGRARIVRITESRTIVVTLKPREVIR